LDNKQFDKRILYALVALLLISTSLKISPLGGITYGPHVVKAASTPIIGNVSLTVNETFVIDEWRREIVVDAWGGISASDYYLISNNRSEEIFRMPFLLPANASNIFLQDAYGEYAKEAIVASPREEYMQVNITLREMLKPGERDEFLIVYELPSSRYISKEGWQDYTLKLNLVKPENWFVRKFSLVISLPEGAEIKNFSEPEYKIERRGLSVKIILTKYDLIEFNSSHITLEYQYVILWAAFKPMIWAAGAAVVGAAFVYIKRFLHPTVAVTPISPSVLKKFVEVYEEKRRLSRELETLQKQFRRGRLSRRRLKLKRSSLGQRLVALNKRLGELKDQIIAAAGRYEEMLKELETAEAEIETLNADIERVEARFRRGEISGDVRRRLLDEYSRIKERAESTISRILLRLQEESI